MIKIKEIQTPFFVKFREVKHNIFTLSYEGLTVTAQVTETGLKISP